MFLRRVLFRRITGRALAVLLALAMVLTLAFATAAASADEKQEKAKDGEESLLYKIEYYYDGKIDKSKTERLEVTAPDFMVFEKDIPYKGGAGYQPDPKAPFEPKLPAAITAKNDVIKVFYTTLPDYGQYAPFTVEYYYDGVLDESMTETVEAVAPGFVVCAFMIPDKAGPGYQQDPVAPYEPELPALVYAEGKLVKAYYVSLPGYVHQRPYTVEYYYDGELDEGKTETLYAYGPYFTVQEEDIPGKCGLAYQPDFGDWYKPQLPTVIGAGNDVVRVNYVGLPDYGPPIPFKVEYYYDGVLDESKTEIRNALPPGYGVDEDWFPDKAGPAYQLDPYMPYEPKLPTHPWGGNDVIKVFYTMLPDFSQFAPYTVEYYYDGELDETKTENLSAVAPDFKVYEDDIPDKTEPGYQLDSENPYDPDLPAPVYGSWGSDLVNVFYVSEETDPPLVDDPVAPPTKVKPKKDKKKAEKKPSAPKHQEPVQETPPPPAISTAVLPTYTPTAPAVYVQQLARTPVPALPTAPAVPEAQPEDLSMVPPIDREPIPSQEAETPVDVGGPTLTLAAENPSVGRGPGAGILLLVLAAVGIAFIAERAIGAVARRKSILKQ